MPSKVSIMGAIFCGGALLIAAAAGRTEDTKANQRNRERFDRPELIAELFRRFEDAKLGAGGEVIHEDASTVRIRDKGGRYETEIHLTGASAHTIDGYIRLFNVQGQCVHDQRIDMDVLAHMLGQPDAVYGTIEERSS